MATAFRPYPSNSLHFCVAFSPPPVSTTTVVSSGPIAPRFNKRAQARRRDRAGRLGVEPGMREPPARGDDLLLRHRDGAAARAPHRRQNFAPAHRPAIAVPSAMVGFGSIFAQASSPRAKAATIGAQFSGCAANSRGSSRDFAAPQQFAKADVAAEHVAARAGRDHDIVRRAEAEVLPELIGERLRALQEERLPVVAGVEDRPRLPDRLVRRILARAGHEFDLARHRRASARSWTAGYRRARGSWRAFPPPPHRPRSPRRRCRNCPRALRLTPCWRSAEIITDAPRSLKLPVGENHSSLNRARAPSQRRSTSGVRPSPIVTGSSIGERQRGGIAPERALAPRRCRRGRCPAAARSSAAALIGAPARRVERIEPRRSAVRRNAPPSLRTRQPGRRAGSPRPRR